MIVDFRSKAIRLYWEKNDSSKLPPDQVKRIAQRLSVLNRAKTLDDIAVFENYKLHSLNGVDRHSIWVTGNWRLTFEFKDGNVYILDHEDYHKR